MFGTVPHYGIDRGCLGLRAGEIVGLQWADFDFDKLTLLVQRGVVHGRVGEVKTEYSRDFVPLAPELAGELLAYRQHCTKHRKDVVCQPRNR